MRVAFIIPEYTNVWEPVGVASIISYCKYHYKDKLAMTVVNLNFKDTVLDYEYLRKFDIIAFSATTPTYPRCVEIATELHGNHTVIGGWHPTATPLTISRVFKQVVIGEGEVSFLRILYGNRDRFVSNTRKIEFHELLLPDREAIDQNKMLDMCESICGERIISIQSRRGCSHNCTFCSEKLMSGSNVRVRHADEVLRELNLLSLKYDFDKFKFLDPTWAYPYRAVTDFCNTKIQRKNTIPFEANAHIAYIDEYVLRFMKQAGCETINFGVETGSQKLLNDMNKGVTLQKIRDVFKWAKEEGISRRAFFILGMPNETLETIDETRQLIYDIEPDIFGMTILCPYPGTPYWKEEFDGTDFTTMDEYSNNIWYTDNFTNLELKQIQKSFNREFNDTLVAHKK